MTHHASRYILYEMIESFAGRATHELYLTGKSRRWSSIVQVATRKLDQLAAAVTLDDLAVPPGNRLEALKGDRQGQHSIRINGQWRICFVWREGNAYDVEIVDYH